MLRKSILLLMLIVCSSAMNAKTNTPGVEKWKVFEVSFKGPQNGNPFTDVTLNATFTNGIASVNVSGFYDGGGVYRLRFMPSAEGRWSYVTTSNAKQLNNKKGILFCTPAKQGNHGYVAVADTFHFAYADGKPYYPFGTTCYAWVHQGDSLATVTLNTLKKGYFNKMRMCIFPKSYDWNHNEPVYYPYVGKPLTDWDFTRFNPQYFRNIEKYIKALDEMGIEADLIIFHPYDRWNFSKMTREQDDLYIKYVIARFAAYKNVWWSMANEYDFMRNKTMSDWDHTVELFGTLDPYHHLLGIHNGHVFYDHSNKYITHACIQDQKTEESIKWRDKYRKPVIYDECRYEGNISSRWGALTGEEMTARFWRGVVNGGYVGHGETYLVSKNDIWPDKCDDVLWWAKGGVLRGESPERIKFLHSIIEAAPAYLQPLGENCQFIKMPTICKPHEYYLSYIGDQQPRNIIVNLPNNEKYTVEVIDTWDMTIRKLPTIYSGKSLVPLPGKPYIALRFTRN